MRKKYTLEDFLQDSEFVRWAKNPDPESSEFWNSFANTHSEYKADMLKAREMVRALKLSHHEVPADIKQEVLENIVHKINEKALNRQTDKGPNWWNSFLRVAAVIALSVGAFYIFYQISKTENQETVEQTQVIEKASPIGRKLQTQLPDGTMVWLNAGSNLTYTKSETSGRRVELSGEAFFDVAKDSLHPFIVQAGALSVRTIGTSFNVRSYTKDTNTEVALVTGKVSVKNRITEDQDIELIPGEKAVILKNESKINKLPFDYLYEVGWKEGILVFDHADFEEVQKKLERWYGVPIHPGNDEITQNWDMSGKYHDQSLEMVLRHLSYTKNFDFSIESNAVILTKK